MHSYLVLAQKWALVALLLPWIAPGQPSGQTKDQNDQRGASMFRLTSTAFKAEGGIPQRFTCDGDNISPPLAWSGAPQGTRSFALIMHDPDAPKPGGYTHWVVYNIPSTVTHLEENAPKQERLPDGGIQGENDSGRIGYTGPCPPSGTHRYYFRLYALDREVDLKGGASKSELESAMKGHILAQAELMGKYKRSSS
jgi:Raf kinase inhibitor-like YbhB/YbcL family protein